MSVREIPGAQAAFLAAAEEQRVERRRIGVGELRVERAHAVKQRARTRPVELVAGDRQVVDAERVHQRLHFAERLSANDRRTD